MAILAPQFAEALKRVEPKDKDLKNAAKAHKGVREALEKDAELVDMGIDTILIGSYARHVSIRRMRDVDVFSKLPRAGEDLGSRTILKKFAKVLTEAFGKDRVESQDRSVKVEFPDYVLSVDSVPARPKDAHWQIPDRTDRTGEWEDTNPERLGELSTEMNKRHEGMYVPTVKLIRQTRRTHLSDQPGGLYFEVLTYHAFNRRSVAGPSVAEYYCSALGGVVAELEVAVLTGLDDPTLSARRSRRGHRKTSYRPRSTSSASCPRTLMPLSQRRTAVDRRNSSRAFSARTTMTNRCCRCRTIATTAEVSGRPRSSRVTAKCLPATVGSREPLAVALDAGNPGLYRAAVAPGVPV